MITFYPTVSRGELGRYSVDLTRAMLPASSWASEEVRKYGKVRRSIPVPRRPSALVDVACDCGGFVASRKWGDYRYTPEQYVEWLDAIRPRWAALMDYCCEDPLTGGDPDVVRQRQDKTTELAWHLWQKHQASWAWVPTIQGWEIADYERHIGEMKPLILEMQAHYGKESAFRVGIGTLCARKAPSMIREVVQLVARALPGMPLHLWGVKLSVLQAPVQLPIQVVSIDSGAWNGMWAYGRNHWKESGLTQRQWCFDVALPAYEAKIRAALHQPKQMTLEDLS